ncbi:hypothetical protein ACWT_3590 [Actinoplanes sp. SE50]|uniref:hypothetical protein n=1 Tax=unclassified Actinoplanes TaxID=2626549 RepID=UPI00023EC2A5|nr:MULTISPECIES: hypothetical protein [unclassified Actinoplanes]AEV84613.1 hypothetical protein ACPL_3718 [Actinoplanes sp. SE50/110]ATO83005.1 hypothetical protein ACWT_3590 [Actinoplanes sp. SE50]SLM00413.1 hypothetical protein ACSP50_3645 [Actinoplanes sp. SE50/110]
MSRRPRPAAGGTPPGCTVTVCRGCCCGTPEVRAIDHAAQLARLRQSLAGAAQVRVSGCLDACEHANVIVVQPSPEGRRAGGRPVWLGLVNDPGATDDIIAWVHAGGPGLADPPGLLDLHLINPARRIRQQLT